MRLRLPTAFLAIATAIALAAPCHADGVVLLDFNNNLSDSVAHLRVNSDDSFHVQVYAGGAGQARLYCGIFRMSPDGTLIPTFGSQGRLTTGECERDLAVRPDGSLVILDATALHLQFRDAAGVLVSTSGRIYPTGTSPNYKAAANALLRLSNGQFMVGGHVGTCSTCDPGDLEWGVARLNADGSVDMSFANGNGLLLQHNSTEMVTLVELPDGKVMGAGYRYAFGDATELSRFDSVGLDFTYGLNARASVSLGDMAKIAADSSGRTYIAGRNGDVVRMTTSGTVDGTYTSPAPTASVSISAIAVDSMDRVLVFGGTAGRGYIARFTSTGARDTTFNGTGVVTFDFQHSTGGCLGALQSQDRPLVACGVSNLNGVDLGVARFTEAGQLDITFGANQPDTDLYPDAFSFPDASASYGTLNVESAPATVSGFDAGRQTTVNISDPNARLSIGCNGTWAASGFIASGQSLCVRHNASSTPGGTSVLTVEVGGRQTTFTVVSTSTAADSIPDAFAFTAQTNVPLSTVVTSNNIRVQGITGYSTATVTNGTFSVGCNDAGFVTSSIHIANGDEVCVRHTSSAQNSTSVITTLSIGGVVASFSSTTVAAVITPPPGGGASMGGGKSGGGGALDELLLGALAMCAVLSLLSRDRRRIQAW
jgi:uncharacterized delta-60 repeat protein